MDVAMVVIPEPAEGTRSVLVGGNKDGRPVPLVTDDGEINYLCGACGFTVAKGLQSASQVAGMVLQCSRCAAFNETRT